MPFESSKCHRETIVRIIPNCFVWLTAVSIENYPIFPAIGLFAVSSWKKKIKIEFKGHISIKLLIYWLYSEFTHLNFLFRFRPKIFTSPRINPDGPRSSIYLSATEHGQLFIFDDEMGKPLCVRSIDGGYHSLFVSLDNRGAALMMWNGKKSMNLFQSCFPIDDIF